MTYLESGLDKFIHKVSPCIEEFCEDKFKREQQKLVESALVDQEAQRYEDMAAAMKKLVKATYALNKDLSQMERQLLFFAYKQLVEQRMASRQALIHMDNDIDNYTAEDFEKRVEIDEEKKKIEAEIEDICKTVLHLIKEYLLPKASGVEAEVFYYKMKGKFLYYLYEVTFPTKHELIQECMLSYEEAYSRRNSF
uniref:14-3-3 domain-containing protein n=1 Tax=Ditylenchus dipsaci TaxID=166011 RepID=A0A915E874_9BILA